MPTITLTARELEELPEYSCSLPTGTTVGKRWKRDINAYRPLENPDPEVDKLQKQMIGPDWRVGEYFEPTAEERAAWGWPPDDIGIRWYKVVVT